MNEAPPFISLPIYTAATTTASPPPPPPPMFDTTTTSAAAAVKRKTPQPPLTVPAGCTCFRLLCHASRIGGVIGKSGAVIKHLQTETSARIRVEDPPPNGSDSDDRVISVVAAAAVNRTLTFDDNGGGGYAESDSEYREVSAAQEGLVRVYERVLSVAAETDGGYFAPGGIVSCRLLADTALVGSVIGKGGKVVEKIRRDTGCRIRIFNQDKLPPCAMPNDEMVEIEGDILAIKRALVAVARRLQDSPVSDKPRTVFGRPPYNGTRETPFTNGHTDFPSARNFVSEPIPTSSSGYRPWENTLQNGYSDFTQARMPVSEPTSSANHTVGGRHFVPPHPEFAPPVDFRNPESQYEIVFRILCSTDRVGGVIGKSGTIVRALQNESGASIVVEAPTTSDCDDRLITVTAMESAESQNSAAQKAIILVFSRSVEAGYERGLELPSARTPISARLLIMPNQVGCLLGKGGSIIADMRKVTGAYIKIVPIHQVSGCTSEADQVVLMTGEFVNVRDALYSVTGRLRNQLFSNRMYNGPKTKSSYGYGVGHSVATPQNFNQQTSLTQSMDNLRLNNNVDQPSSSRQPWESQAEAGNPLKGQDVDRGSTSVKGGIELGRGGRSAIVKNTTVEIVVPENVIGSIYGENGSNLTRLRQISGAKVVVHQPVSGSSEHTVIISGTPDETQSAQSLLQAFILADQQ